jgi:hypothetical protein
MTNHLLTPILFPEPSPSVVGREKEKKFDKNNWP